MTAAPLPAMPGGRRHAHGFTLVEVVVALSLISLVMLGLISALAAFGNGATRLEQRVMAADETRLISGFLREALGRVSTNYRDDTRTDRPSAMFSLRDGQLVWLGVMPARHGVGGLHRMRLALQQSGAEPGLVLQYQVYDGGELETDWSQAPRHHLLEGVTRFDVRVRGNEAPREWQTEWDKEGLPEVVDIELTVGETRWPSLLVHINPIDPAGGGVRIVHGPVGTR